MSNENDKPVIWYQGGPYPPEGMYRLTLTNGRVVERPMSPDWTWDDSWDGARIDIAVRIGTPA